jgi:glutathione S-transferase
MGVYRFYGTEVSYFSGKVRPALRFKGLDYEEIQPTLQVYREVILPRTGLAFIPVLLTPDDQMLQDTSVILDELERRHPAPALYPSTPVQRVVAYLFELYADEFMTLPAMHYRWSFPESEAKARSDFAASNGDPDRASAFADRMKGSLPVLGVTAATAPAIEAHLRELLAALSEHFEAQPFLLGEQMSLADCALLGPMYAHLYLDAVPGRLLRETARPVCGWIERMNAPRPVTGPWTARDALAPTLRPVLELIGRDAVPIHRDDLEAVLAWATDHRDQWRPPPRGLGFHETSLRGVAMSRMTSAYSLFMLQRPLDAYASLAPAERAAVESALDGTGCEALLELGPTFRAEKDGFQLAYSEA